VIEAKVFFQKTLASIIIYMKMAAINFIYRSMSKISKKLSTLEAARFSPI